MHMLRLKALMWGLGSPRQKNGWTRQA